MHFCYFGTGLVPFQLHSGSILTRNQVEPKALVLEPEWTGTLTAQNFRFQNAEFAVISIVSFLDQYYLHSVHKSTGLNVMVEEISR